MYLVATEEPAKAKNHICRNIVMLWILLIQKRTGSYMKDPALLFYTSDFLTGTMTMNNEQVGKYIRLLCLQHQKRTLSEKDMLHVCGTYDEDVYSKFKKEDGGYYNERLRIEADRRKSFCDSRRRSRTSNVRGTYDRHTETETETETIAVNKDVLKKDGVEGNKTKRMVPPTLEAVKTYCAERANRVDPKYFFDRNTATGWVDKNGRPYRDWKAVVRIWENYDNTRRIDRTSSKLPQELKADI